MIRKISIIIIVFNNLKGIIIMFCLRGSIWKIVPRRKWTFLVMKIIVPSKAPFLLIWILKNQVGCSPVGKSILKRIYTAITIK